MDCAAGCKEVFCYRAHPAGVNSNRLSAGRGKDMIQDIKPHQYDNKYRHVAPDGDSIALYFEEQTFLVKRTQEGMEFPRFRDLERQNEGIYEDSTYLFSIDRERYYLVDDINREPLSSYTMENTEIFRTAEPQYRAFAGITGYQLYTWYRNHRYCGRCGSLMKKDVGERMLYCGECHTMEYPKICPAVIIGVTDGSRILLSKYAGRTYKKHALLAGFVEIGETVRDTVRREVMEEVGLKVKNIRFYKSQPWSFSDTILLGFFCDLDGDDTITLDKEELSMAEWFERADIPAELHRDSLTNEMMMKFKNNEL